jgi:putative hydrolase of HD superfamily
MPPSAIDIEAPTAANGSVKKPINDVGIVPTPKVSDPWTVDKVIATIPQGGRPVEGSSSPLAYFHLLERLKTMKREGWRRFGIDRYVLPKVLRVPGADVFISCRGESIADHMYRMSLMSMLAPPALAARLDMNKCMKMCLIHDMAESLVGDITPVDGVPKPEKSRREAETMDYICGTLLGNVHDGAVGTEVRAIWQEYEDSQTLESKYIHDIDKMELLTQMVEYERRGEGRLDLGEFAYVATKMVLPETQAWAAEILKEREDLWGAQKHIHGEEGIGGGVKPENRRMQDDYYKRE